MSKYVTVEVTDDGALVVASCPKCSAPCKGPISDGAEYVCTSCDWVGDGYAVMAPGYNKGRIHYREYRP